MIEGIRVDRVTPECRRRQYRRRMRWYRELRALGATEREARFYSTGVVRFRQGTAELRGRK